MSRKKKILLLLPVAVILGAALIRAVLFRGPYLPPRATPRGITDLHVHTAGLGASGSGCFVSPAIGKSFKLGAYFRAFGLSRAEVEREGDAVVLRRIAEWVDESRVVKAAVVLALDGAVNERGELDREKTEIYVPNEFVAAEVKKYPKLRFGASIHPRRPDARERLRWAANEGARLVKWIPPIQDIDPSDPSLTPFYEEMIELGLPLLSHTGRERAFTRSDDRLADPRLLELPLKLGVTVIAAHAASPGYLDALLEMFPRYANLYADISSLTQINKPGYLGKLLRDPRSKGRLVYGSDFPLSNTPLVSPFHFPLTLTLEQMLFLRKNPNPFDRDVALKQSLGVPPEAFHHRFSE